VLVAGAVADKPARLVAPFEPVELQGEAPRFVSRGGEKLQAALERFGVDVADRRVLDVGSSTGGFTDCLLQAGARRVFAVDVGHGQLHARLRSDPRVMSLERADIRSITLERLEGAPVEAAVVDVSFISLTSLVGPILTQLLAPDAPLVVLAKPQFEAGRKEASKGRGVIRDPALHRACLERVADSLGASGGLLEAAMPSPLRGRSGNLEFLLCARRPVDGNGGRCPGVGYPGALLDAVVAEAHLTRQG
jgi:23S rRNA (cytidine1920-2'-O)/16S rRNA (cytidine1409-2'-O)-methyltransferase